MNWNIFKNKSTEEVKKVATPSVHTDGTIVEPAFFNVMPKTKVLFGAVPPKTSPPPIKLAEPPKPETKVEAPKVETARSGAGSELPIFKAPPAVESSTSGSGVKKSQILALTVIVVLALVGIGFTVFVFSSSSNIATNVRNAVNALFGRDTNVVVETVPEVVSTSEPEYGTTAEWREKYFTVASCPDCLDTLDVDKDGLSNLEEFTAETVPNNSDTDEDGLADGDELHIFACLPTNAHTGQNPEYTDGQSIQGGWDCNKVNGEDVVLSSDRIKDITNKAKEFGFHEPTITTLKDSIIDFKTTDEISGDEAVKLPEGTDTTPEGILERDVQRLNTIKNMGEALLLYLDAVKSLPPQGTFFEVAEKVKPYSTVALNATDPVNIVPLVYGYELDIATGKEFSLTYYSETQKQVIRYTKAQAVKDVEEASKQSRDATRIEDVEKIRSALLVYSATVTTQNQTYAFPPKTQYQAKISPQYIQTIPHDPLTQADYAYEPSKDGSSFTLKAILEQPTPGTTGYVCDPEDCKAF